MCTVYRHDLHYGLELKFSTWIKSDCAANRVVIFHFMSDMEVLRVNRRVATLFVMCSNSGEDNVGSKVAQIVRIIFYLVILISVDWFCVGYATERLQLDGIENSAFALTQATAIFTSIASYVSLIYEKRNVRQFFDIIQSVFHRCNCIFHSLNRILRSEIIGFVWFLCVSDEDTPSARIYLRVNVICELFMTWASIFIVGSFLASTFVSISGGILFYYGRDGHIDTAKLYLPLKLVYIIHTDSFTWSLSLFCFLFLVQ